MRIVSLLPSATDIVSALGAGDELVGVSHSCDPVWSHLPALTSTRINLTASSAVIDAEVKTAGEPLYDLDIELLDALAPDVVVSQSLCDVCAVASGDVEEAVSAISSHPRLINLSPFCLTDIPTGFADVGGAIDRMGEAEDLVSNWHQTLSALRKPRAIALKIAFLDWLDPPFAAGHWIPDIIELLGCESVLAKPGEPSYETTWASIRESNPDLILAACCGFSTDRASEDAIPDDVNVQLLDGYEMFSRPSPNILGSIRALNTLLGRSG